jgi:hypothetical protein
MARISRGNFGPDRRGASLNSNGRDGASLSATSDPDGEAGGGKGSFEVHFRLLSSGPTEEGEQGSVQFAWPNEGFIRRTGIQSTSSTSTVSPLTRCERAAAMYRSRSPSSTSEGAVEVTPVRRSFTI